MVDIKLKTFITVCETKSYTLAAQQLHLSQPAITQHIKQLEQYYHTKLIAHPHKEFTLSDAGQQLYSYAKIQLRNEALFESRIHAITSPRVIGATLSIADYYLFDVLDGYFATSNNCKIVVDNTATLLQKMMDGEVDCAFVEGKFDSAFFDFHLFSSERFVPAVRACHPLAKQSVQMEQLLEYPLYVREQGSGTRSILESYLEQSIYSIQSFPRCYEIESMTLIKNMLVKSDGISFLYERVVEEEVKKGTLSILQLPDFPLHHDMYFIYLNSNLEKDMLAEMFLRMMKKSAV